MYRFFRFFSCLVILSLSSFLQLNATNTNSKPRLVVLITIDGFQNDMLNKYWYSIGNNGFKRLIEYGQYTPNSSCNYIPNGNITDYASLYTGSYPYYHGIVADQFYSKASDSNIQIINNPDYVGINSGLHVSPDALMATTIIDELKLSDPRSKAYAIAINPAEALMMGGHLADGATWLDNHTAEIATTNYYNKGLPSWCAKLNQNNLVNTWREKSWQPDLALNAYHFNSITTRGLFEQKPTFYHQNGSHTTEMQMNAFKNTPLVNEVIKEIATTTIREGKLGYDNITDFLAIQFNANTEFTTKGPSAETEDMYIRLDRTINELLNTIDITIGLHNAVIVVTSNYQEHNSAEYLSKMHIPTGEFNGQRTMAILNSYLMAVYGQGLWVDGYYGRQVYLNKKLIEDKKLNLEDIEEFTAQFLLEFAGVHSAYAARSLQKIANSSDDRMTKMRNSFFKNRSGDVVFNLLPGWTEVNDQNQTMGVTSYTNSRVPIIIFGINTESFKQNPSTQDIVPTLCQIMQIPFPNACIGEPVIK